MPRTQHRQQEARQDDETLAFGAIGRCRAQDLQICLTRRYSLTSGECRFRSTWRLSCPVYDKPQLTLAARVFSGHVYSASEQALVRETFSVHLLTGLVVQGRRSRCTRSLGADVVVTIVPAVGFRCLEALAGALKGS